nr:unnamed protein product [Callosobruchus chinensis]
MLNLSCCLFLAALNGFKSHGRFHILNHQGDKMIHETVIKPDLLYFASKSCCRVNFPATAHLYCL